MKVEVFSGTENWLLKLLLSEKFLMENVVWLSLRKQTDSTIVRIALDLKFEIFL